MALANELGRTRQAAILLCRQGQTHVADAELLVLGTVMKGTEVLEQIAAIPVHPHSGERSLPGKRCYVDSVQIES